MISVKLSIPGAPSDADLSQYTGNQQNLMGDVKFHVNSKLDRADYWFVIEGPNTLEEKCSVPEGNLIFLSAETVHPSDYFLTTWGKIFFEQFDAVYSCLPTPSNTQRPAAPFLPWMVNSNHGTFFEPHERDLNFLRSYAFPEKSAALSVICSTKSGTEHHRVRLDFVRRLSTYFGDDLHWFGEGIRPLSEKWDGLNDYQVSICIENKIQPGIYSEKILDPFLTWTKPLYIGASDIGNFLPLNGDSILDFRDFEGSVTKIKAALLDVGKASSVESLMVGREKVLGELHFLNRIVSIIEEKEGLGRPHDSAIRSVRTLRAPIRQRIGRRILRKLEKVLSPDETLA